MVALEVLADLVKLAASPVGQSILDAIITGGAASPDHVAAEVAKLKAQTDDAMALNIFGVPAFEVDGKVFWGLDALPMLRAYLKGDAWFTESNWNAPMTLPSGLPPAKS